MLIAQPPPPPLPPPPTVTVQVPAPPIPPPAASPGVAVTVGVPDRYAWDGYEYVGFVGDQYYYLGAGDIWLPLGPDRVVRFHDWERHHHDWRDHALWNDRYRRDSHGHEYPWHDHHHGH